MLWLYINFPSLQLDFIQITPPSKTSNQDGAKDKSCHAVIAPSVVVMDSQRNAIVQYNDAAKAQGVTREMGLGIATSLISELNVLPYQREKEETHLHVIAEQLYTVAADIVLFPPHGLAIKVGNMLRLYGSLNHYITLLQAILDPLNVNTVLACSYSVCSAQLLACSGIELISDNKAEIQSAIAQVTISQLLIKRKSKEDITRLGIHTVSQLYALPIHERAKHFNVEIIEYLTKLQHDYIEKSLVFYQPKQYFEHSIELLYEIKHVVTLLQPITKLLSVLEDFLYRRDISCSTITIHLFHYTNGETNIAQHSLVVKSAGSEYMAKSWLTLVELKLAHIQLIAPITSIQLNAKAFHTNRGDINDIFDGKKGQLTFTQLASLLVNKLGGNNVQRIHIVNDYRAEITSHYVPFLKAREYNLSTDVGTINDCSSFYAEHHRTLPLRPSFILAVPEPLLSDVHILNGPERVETAWWESSPNFSHTDPNQQLSSIYQRDYYIAKNTQGQCCWIYRDLNKRWYVHGYFS